LLLRDFVGGGRRYGHGRGRQNWLPGRQRRWYGRLPVPTVTVRRWWWRWNHILHPPPVCLNGASIAGRDYCCQVFC